jgi:hypothetical protein
VHRSSLPDFMKLYSDLNGMRESIIEHHDEWLEEIQSIQQEYLKEKKS